MNSAKLENELRKRQLYQSTEEKLINRTEANLMRFKELSAKSETSLKKLSEFNEQYSSHQQMQKHKTIWLEEKERLDAIRRVLELQYHHWVKMVISQVDPKEDCYAIAAELHHDMENNDYSNCSKALREKVMNLVSVKPNVTNESQEDAFLDSIDELTEESLMALDELYKRCQKIEKQNEKWSHLLKIDPKEFMDEWIFHDDEYVQFKDLKFQQETLQEQHEKTCRDLICWYQSELDKLSLPYKGQPRYDGWSEKDHFRFQKIKEEYHTQLADRFILFFERVKKEMPHLSKQRISAHYDWCDRHHFYIERKKAITKIFLDHTLNLIPKTIQAITDERLFLENEAERDRVLQNRIEDMEIRHFRIQKYREQKLEAMKKEAEMRNIELKRQLEAESAKLEKEKNRRMNNKSQLHLYHQQLLEKRKEEEAIQMAMVKKELAEKKLIAKFNEERVNHRASKRQAKQEEHRKKLLLIQKEKDDLEKRLDKLRQSVQVIVESDWNRVIQDTVAMSEHRKQEQKVFPNDKVDWFPMIGFSSDKIIKDKRMQLSIALHRNGLSHSKYGHELLASMLPPVKRLDTISNIKFE